MFSCFLVGPTGSGWRHHAHTQLAHDLLPHIRMRRHLRHIHLVQHEIGGFQPLVMAGHAILGVFRVDLRTQQLLHDEKPVPLAGKTFETLVVLLKDHDRLVPKDQLISKVWPDSFVSEDSLTQNISALRRALGDDPGQPKFIATVARRGYRRSEERRVGKECRL